MRVEVTTKKGLTSYSNVKTLDMDGTVVRLWCGTKLIHIEDAIRVEVMKDGT